MAREAPVGSRFRSDINGLRAWAVMSVVLYHFGVPGFGGGFVGVDVFFVISGFLMTGMVVKALEQKRFSLWGFYMARARRILPALVLLCAVLLSLGWWGLLPLDYQTLAAHALSSLTFLSNIQFWREAGYFDSASRENWLLHTWSLAVEWQFYLLLPLGLLAAWKLRPTRSSATVLVTGGLLLSWGLCVWITPLRPTPAFYLLPTRAWEMLAGGWVCLHATRLGLRAHHRARVQNVGMGLIVLAVVTLDTASPWPGWRAGLPVMGAAMVLLADHTGTRWLGHPIAQWLGTRSYSLYLWHWPVVVALVYADLQGQPWATAAGLALTLGLGHLSYRAVENPSRRSLQVLGQRSGALVLLGVLALVAAPAVAIWGNAGLTHRFPPALVAYAAETQNSNPRQPECHASAGVSSPSCRYGGQQLRAIMLGDSHANALVTALAAATPRADDAVMEWSYSACPTLFGAQASPRRHFSAAYHCDLFLDWAERQLDQVPADVALVIVNRTTHYALGFNEPWEQDANTNTPLVYFHQQHTAATADYRAAFAQHVVDTACRLAVRHTVYLVRPIPEMGVDVPKSARTAVWSRPRDVFITRAAYHQRHDFVWAAQDAARDRCGIKILDPLPYLCSQDRCDGARAGRPLYYDDDHLSEYGNKLLVPMFAAVFRTANPVQPLAASSDSAHPK